MRAWVVGGARHSQPGETAQRPKSGATKLSAAKLESALRQANRLGPEAEFHCQAASRDWDYVCSYLPTALPSPTRLQFGINVDATRWVKLSPVVPIGTAVPGPE